MISGTESKNLKYAFFVALPIVIGIAGVFAWQYFVPQKDATKTPQAAQDETANRKTYSNEEFGFEVRYPSEWILYENQQNVSTAKSDEWLPVDTLPPGHAKIWWERTGVQTVDDIIKERFGSTTNYQIVSDSTKKINDLEGREIIYTCKNCEAKYIEEIDKSLPGQEGRVLFFSKDSDVIFLWLVYYKGDPRADYYAGTFQGILPTFHFIETSVLSESNYRAVELKDVINYSDIAKNNYVKTKGTVVAFEYDDYGGSILLSEKSDYLLVAIAHISISDCKNTLALATLQKGDIIEVRGVAHTTAPKDWKDTTYGKLYFAFVQQFPNKIGMIDLDCEVAV